ncbi:MAG: hypothetical protein LBR79_04290 [Oscillospiraceae bacterium]|nr:hypothetical protein [Oscillospiraceae bacterium]
MGSLPPPWAGGESDKKLDVFQTAAAIHTLVFLLHYNKNHLKTWYYLRPPRHRRGGNKNVTVHLKKVN